jgi:hypothetical protein
MNFEIPAFENVVLLGSALKVFRVPRFVVDRFPD